MEVKVEELKNCLEKHDLRDTISLLGVQLDNESVRINQLIRHKDWL